MWKVKFVSVFCDRVEVMYPRVAELNPYVQVGVSTCPLDDGTDLSFLRGYQVCSLHHLYHTTKVGSIYVCWLMFTFLCWYSVSCWRMLVWVCKRKWMNSAIPNSLLLQYVYFFLFKCPRFLYLIVHVLHTENDVVVLTVYWLWASGCVCSCLLWFWRRVWGVWCHRRGVQGAVYTEHHSGNKHS